MVIIALSTSESGQTKPLNRKLLRCRACDCVSYAGDGLLLDTKARNFPATSFLPFISSLAFCPSKLSCANSLASSVEAVMELMAFLSP